MYKTPKDNPRAAPCAGADPPLQGASAAFVSHKKRHIEICGYCHAPTRPLWSFWLLTMCFVDHANLKFQTKHALFLVLSGRGLTWRGLPAPQLIVLAENRHSDPTSDGAAGPVPRWPNRLAVIINGPWAIPMAPSRRQSPVHVRRWVSRQFYSQQAQKSSQLRACTCP